MWSAAAALALGAGLATAGAAKVAAQGIQLPSRAAGTVFLNATLVDGRSPDSRSGVNILVAAGRIQEIGSDLSDDVIPEDEVIDLGGAFVVPGFVDVHAGARTEADLRALAEHGILAVRDGTVTDAIWRQNGRESPGRGLVARRFAGGPVLGGRAAAPGDDSPDSEQFAAQIERQRQEGAGFITIGPGLPAELLVSVARSARRAELPLWTDRRGGTGWLLSVRAGTDVVTGLLSGDPDMVAAEIVAGGPLAEWLRGLDPHGEAADLALGALLSRDALVVPLLVSAGPEVREDPEAWANAVSLAARLVDSSVRMAVGSDSPAAGDFGAAFHLELELLQEIGIPPVEIIGMATRIGAAAIGELHERGTLEVGKRADFVVLDGNPLADIRNARRIAMVVAAGRAWREEPEGVWTEVRMY